MFLSQLRNAVSVIALLCFTLPASMLAQSGATTTRGSGREYGVNLTYAAYQYDAVKSPAIEDLIRLSGTFSTADDEIGHLKDKYKLEEVSVRHVRSAGLRNGDTFNDAVLLGPEYMTFLVTARDVIRGHMKLDIKVRYANKPLLEANGLELESYETVVLRGGKGMFGLKYFVGVGGRQENAPIERTLLVSVTPEIVPVANLRNRPEQLSQPVDEYGTPIRTVPADRFTPPVALERVTPKFDAGRGIRGSVLLAGVVTPQGKVINVRVLRSLDRVIDDRAVDAFRQFTFSPALLNGKPVHATFREEISFSR